MSDLRVAVCGGRNYRNFVVIGRTLDEIHARTPINLLIHGDAPGADRHAAGWALRNGIDLAVYPALWCFHGRAAGPIRNSAMLRHGRPHFVVAFPGGEGTENMVGRALGAGVPVIMVNELGETASVGIEIPVAAKA